MKKGLWHKRIPNLAALVLLLGGLWVSLLLIQSGVFFVGRAGPSKIPANVVTSNITDKSFTVTFTTNDKTLSALSVEEGISPPYIVYDDRNTRNQEREEYFSHYITVHDLKPNTNYNFSILSDGQTYLDGNNKYSVTTGAPIVSDPPVQNPIVGNILLSDGQPGNDTIVELEIENAQLITVLTGEKGDFVIPTNSIRNNSLNEFLLIPENQELTITARRQDTSSTIRTLFSGNTIVPPITLNKTYDFTKIEEAEVATLSSALSFPTPRIGIGEVRITVPAPNQTLVDSRPQFRGTGVARQEVRISIDNELLAEITTDGNGVWVYRPDENIPAGEHDLTIISDDRFGIPKSISQTFTVFSAGAQVSQEATPSATPTLAASPTQTPTPIISLTVSPTAEPSITILPTVTESPTISPTVIVTPTAAPTITSAPTFTPTTTTIPSITPPSPGSGSAIIFTFISILLIGAGGALLFLL